MRICRVTVIFVVFEFLESCEPLVAYLGTAFRDSQPWDEFFEAKLSSRDQVGCKRSLPEDQNPGIQGSLAVSVAR